MGGWPSGSLPNSQHLGPMAVHVLPLSNKGCTTDRAAARTAEGLPNTWRLQTLQLPGRRRATLQPAAADSAGQGGMTCVCHCARGQVDAAGRRCLATPNSCSCMCTTHRRYLGKLVSHSRAVGTHVSENNMCSSTAALPAHPVPSNSRMQSSVRPFNTTNTAAQRRPTTHSPLPVAAVAVPCGMCVCFGPVRRPAAGRCGTNACYRHCMTLGQGTPTRRCRSAAGQPT